MPFQFLLYVKKREFDQFDCLAPLCKKYSKLEIYHIHDLYKYGLKYTVEAYWNIVTQSIFASHCDF